MSNPSQKQLFAMFGVFVLAFAALVGVSMIGSEDSEAAFSTGSSSNPLTSFSGTLDDVSAGSTYYVKVGTSISISATSSLLFDAEACDSVSYFGLSVSSTSLSGTLTSSSDSSFSYTTIQYYTDGSDSDSAFSIVPISASSESILNFTSPAAVDCVSKSSVSYLATVNVANCTFSSTSSSTWLTLSSSGKLTGTAPSVSKLTSYSFDITAKSKGGQTATQTVTFDVYPVAQLTATSTTITGKVGTAISAVTVSSNLAASLSYTNTSGTLSGIGLSFDSSTGKISGTPSAAGTVKITVKGTTTVGPTQTPSIVLTIIISEKDLSITSSPPTGIYKVGSQWSYSPVANQTVTWSLVDAPSWLTLTEGKISGQVTGYTSSSTVTFQVKATTSANHSVIQNVSIAVEPVLAFTSIPVASCVVTPVYDYKDDGSFTLKSLAAAVSLSVAPVSTVQDEYIVLGAPMVLGDAADSTADDFTDSNDSTDSNDGSSSDGSSTSDDSSKDDSKTDDATKSDAVAPSFTVVDTRTFKFVWTGEYAESVVWDFGDGTTAEGFSVFHSYAKDGTYHYSCTGINSLGQSKIEGTITVSCGEVIDITMYVLVGLALLIVIGVVYHFHKKSKTSNAGRRSYGSKSKRKSAGRR